MFFFSGMCAKGVKHYEYAANLSIMRECESQIEVKVFPGGGLFQVEDCSRFNLSGEHMGVH